MANPKENLYQTRSPILFLIFNRPESTQRVFEAIRAARPKHLYIAADGPRQANPDDMSLCSQTREIVNQIDWDCQLETLFRTKNSGCKRGVSEAINWFFAQEEEGIILEDDCLPANSFFKFCDELLDRYRDDTRIRHITGCNLQFGKVWSEASYYFSNRVHVWGWATWKRAWNDYDITLGKYDAAQVKQGMKKIYSDDLVAEAWTRIFIDQKAGKVNSWAYPLDFANFLNGGLVIIPNQNLISNIGFSAGATNTLAEESIYANIPLIEIDQITHPTEIIPQIRADLSIINRDFGIDKQRQKQNALHRRIKSWFKNLTYLSARNKRNDK
jgi:hypothetical protein